MIYLLPETSKHVMCAFCLRKATHYFIDIPMSGKLLAVCEEHTDRERGIK